jgi:hypothetical protein
MLLLLLLLMKKQQNDRKGLKGKRSNTLMPEIVTKENAADNRTCSKCKRRQYAFKFITDGRIFKTCNACREKSWLRTHPISLWVNDAVRTYTPPDDSDADTEAVFVAVSNLISSSSSSAAAAAGNSSSVLYLTSSSSSSAAAAAADSSSVLYFVEEPEPEPEPDD